MQEFTNRVAIFLLIPSTPGRAEAAPHNCTKNVLQVSADIQLLGQEITVLKNRPEEVQVTHTQLEAFLFKSYNDRRSTRSRKSLNIK